MTLIEEFHTFLAATAPEEVHSLSIQHEDRDACRVRFMVGYWEWKGLVDLPYLDEARSSNMLEYAARDFWSATERGRGGILPLESEEEE